MRPSELKASFGESVSSERKLKWPIDPQAEPPITYEEALVATSALCAWHPGSLIGQRGEKPGMVHLCTHRSCRMYKRFDPRRGPSRRKLVYPVRAVP
jgi:hypothetical protein